MAQTAAHLVEHVIPPVPVRQWVLWLPIPLRLPLAAQPKLQTPVLQGVHRAIRRYLPGQTGLKAAKADSGAITLIQRFGSAANLNIPLHCLVLDGVCRRSADGAPVFVEVPAPTDEAQQGADAARCHAQANGLQAIAVRRHPGLQPARGRALRRPLVGDNHPVRRVASRRMTPFGIVVVNIFENRQARLLTGLEVHVMHALHLHCTVGRFHRRVDNSPPCGSSTP